MYTQEELEAGKLDGLIDEIVEQLSNVDSAEEQYAKMADQLTKQIGRASCRERV